MLKKKYLVACGGHGRVILESLLVNKIDIDGIIDSGIKKDTLVFGVPVLGDDSFLMELNSSEVILINGFGVNKNLINRRKKYEEWVLKGFEILGTTYPGTLIGFESSISATAQIMAGVILQNRITIEENVVVNTSASIDHDCKIEKHSFLSPGVTICGGVTIHNSVFVGAGAIILPGLEIGEEAIIGAGSVVTKNIPARTKAVGNPAKAIKD